MKIRMFGIGVLAMSTLLAYPLQAQQSEGQAMYREECKSCHGINGTPPARERAKYKKLRTLGDSGFVSALSVDSIVTILTNGIDKNMKSFSSKLTTAEMRQVATYVKELAAKLEARKK